MTAKLNRYCPNCGEHRLFPATLERAGADAPAVISTHCIECGHVWHPEFYAREWLQTTREEKEKG